jgi:7-cyano-7-deazaguanine reductase
VSDASGLKALGAGSTNYRYDKPAPEVLESFPNPNPSVSVTVELECFEFTSLCLHGDTMVDVATDETAHPHGVKISDLVDTTGHVFSFDPQRGVPVVKPYHSVRKTREAAPVLRVAYTLFKGGVTTRKLVRGSMVCTPDHMILTKCGFDQFVWKTASELAPGDKLVSDQRAGDMIRSSPRHRLVAEEREGRSLAKGDLVHHKNHNHYDNTPSNLEVMSNSDHFSHHQSARYGYEGTLDVTTLVREYRSGQSVSELANLHGCDPGTIRDRLEGRVVLRSQRESLLAKPESQALRRVMRECADYYARGYTTYELGKYYQVHPVTISQWVRSSGGKIRTSHEARVLRKSATELAPLNHNVVSVEDAGVADVYNMEVEDTHCFFANGVVVHNCPKTGQPDFATVDIFYAPDEKCVETKSLKLYLGSYRNSGAFMEDITGRILKDLAALLQPAYLRVTAKFNARGGVGLTCVAEHSGVQQAVQGAIERMMQGPIALPKGREVV